MSTRSRCKKLTVNERGFSLVEILIAVTILSIISVTMMSYFVSALEKSADESRRIIAVNLARSKLSELKTVFRGAQYETLLSYLNTGAQNEPHLLTLTSAEIDHHFGPAEPTNGMNAALKSLAEIQTINNTDYRYLVAIDNRSVDSAGAELRKAQLNQLLSVVDVGDKYLSKIAVTVYWSQGASDSPPARYSTRLESYLLERR